MLKLPWSGDAELFGSASFEAAVDLDKSACPFITGQARDALRFGNAVALRKCWTAARMRCQSAWRGRRAACAASIASVVASVLAVAVGSATTFRHFLRAF